MAEAPENSKESSHSTHANGMNEWIKDVQKVHAQTVPKCHREILLVTADAIKVNYF